MFFSINGWSQTGTSTVTGTVADTQGNAVPGASVTLISEQNNRRSTVSNDSGIYTFATVQPGNYKIEVEAKGFKKASVNTFQALVDKPNEINVALEIGQVTETVNIDATGIENIVNTQDASLGNNFVSKQIEQLPLNARNVANLLSLQAAVTPDGSVAGSRSDQANITLDGVDVNNQQQGDAFTPVLRVNPDSVDEFRVTTSNPDATKGRSAGAQISLITKAGTNQFRGALYEYHRNTVTAANDYFNNAAGRYGPQDQAVLDGLAVVGDPRVPRPQLLRNLFGGRLGGPIIKDRLFFFYNFEGLREAKQTTVNQLVPLASLGQGNLKFFDSDGNLVTLNTTQINNLTSGGDAVVNVNPVSLAVLASAAGRYRANNTRIGDGLNTGGFQFNAPQPVKQNAHTARFDWIVTNDQKHQISARFNYQQDTIGGAPAFPDTPSADTWNHPLGLALSHTWLINSNMTNRFSYGLTRLAFSNQGDANTNSLFFRDVFQPLNFTYAFNRVNPTQNFTDDFTWIKGNHSLQFGTNIRVVRNKRANFASSFDNGITNYVYYAGTGNSVLDPLNEYLQNTSGNPNLVVDSGSEFNAGSTLAALFGRINQYTANFNFGLDGQPLAPGTPVIREFATEEYDWYVQDIWKVKPNLTLTLGLRYGLSRPVYETQGYQTAPNIPLQEYFQRRIDAAAQGTNYTDPLTIELAGPVNGGKNFYNWDKNNFQPRIAVAWSPDFKSGWLAKFFGKEQESVIRGGFAITNDYFGQQLAVTFDAANSLGFSSSRNNSANSYNVTDNPAPPFTGSGMPILGLPGATSPGTLTFPQQQPLDGERRIEGSLDTDLQSPINYSWNISYGRKLPFKMYMDVSYVGRAARHLLATRDVMMTNNIRDPKSGQTYYEAATALELQRRAGIPRSQLTPQPFFENIYATEDLDFFGLGGTKTQAVFDFFDLGFAGGTDWTAIQNILDGNTNKQLFYQLQYGALSSFGTISSSDYHAMTVSLRQRAKGITWDFNYTYSKSLDDASGLQTGGNFGTGFILNALRQQDSRSVSDFDLRHIINFNSVWDVPIGRNRQFLKNSNKFVDAFLGGWQLSTIFRYNTGAPIGVFTDVSGWATNWQLTSAGVQFRPIVTGNNKTSGTDADGNGVPNVFADPQAAYNSFRSPLPGETGDRNRLRYPSYVALDAGLAKSFQMPWSENHKVTIRWDVFNVTNTARFTGVANNQLGYEPDKGNIPASFGNFTGQQGSPRVMQFALRYDF